MASPKTLLLTFNTLCGMTMSETCSIKCMVSTHAVSLHAAPIDAVSVYAVSTRYVLSKARQNKAFPGDALLDTTHGSNVTRQTFLGA